MKSQCRITTKGILTFTEAIFNKKIPIEYFLFEYNLREKISSKCCFAQQRLFPRSLWFERRELLIEEFTNTLLDQ